MNWKRLLIAAAALAALAACAAPIVLGIELDDPGGDTIGSGSARWDLLGVATRSIGNRGELLLDFDRAVVLPAPGTVLGDDDLRGFVALDLDHDSGTPAGNPLAALLLGACPEVAELGIDLLIEVFERSAGGLYALRHPSLDGDSVVRPRAEGNTLVLSLPLAELGALDIGIGLEVGSEGVIDCLPDPQATVPEDAVTPGRIVYGRA